MKIELYTRLVVSVKVQIHKDQFGLRRGNVVKLWRPPFFFFFLVKNKLCLFSFLVLIYFYKIRGNFFNWTFGFSNKTKDNLSLVVGSLSKRLFPWSLKIIHGIKYVTK